MAIKKAVFQMVVLFDDATVDSDWVTNADPEILVNEIYNANDLIGQWYLTSVDDVPPTEVEKELLEMSNDGTFFDPA
jgi:hypothetical protein